MARFAADNDSHLFDYHSLYRNTGKGGGRLRRACYCGLAVVLIATDIMYLVDVKHIIPSIRETRQMKSGGAQALEHSQSSTDDNGADALHLTNDKILENILTENEFDSLKDHGSDEVVEGTIQARPIQSDYSSQTAPSNYLSRQEPDASTSTPEEIRPRLWCVIGNDSMWPGVKSWGWHKSVAHFAEAIMPCWSWFVRSHATTNCGFYIVHNLQQPHPWGMQLMDTMGCRVKRSNLPQEWNMTATELERDDEVTIWKEFPFQQGYWFENRVDVDILKSLLLLHGSEAMNTDDELTSRKTLQIGIVNRTGTRQIANLVELQHGIEAVLTEQGISFSLSIQSLDDLTLQQQAAWFASQHILVAVHGAGLTNCLFLQPNATVLSLYPKDYYFVGYFESLITKVGGYNMDWYAGDKSKAKDVHEEMSTIEREAAKKIASFQVSVEDIAALILEASERYVDEIESSNSSR